MQFSYSKKKKKPPDQQIQSYLRFLLRQISFLKEPKIINESGIVPHNTGTHHLSKKPVNKRSKIKQKNKNASIDQSQERDGIKQKKIIN